MKHRFGLEPNKTRSADERLDHFGIQCKKNLVAPEGLEPSRLAAAVSKTAVYAFHQGAMAPRAGLEPATIRLTVGRSTN